MDESVEVIKNFFMILPAHLHPTMTFFNANASKDFVDITTAYGVVWPRFVDARASQFAGYSGLTLDLLDLLFPDLHVHS